MDDDDDERYKAQEGDDVSTVKQHNDYLVRRVARDRDRIHKLEAERDRLEEQEQSLLLLADTYKAARDIARHEVGLYQQTHLEDTATIAELKADFDKLKSLLESAVRCNNTFIERIAELEAERDRLAKELEVQHEASAHSHNDLRMQLDRLKEALEEIDACKTAGCKLCRDCIERVSFQRPKPKPHLTVVDTEQN